MNDVLVELRNKYLNLWNDHHGLYRPVEQTTFEEGRTDGIDYILDRIIKDLDTIIKYSK